MSTLTLGSRRAQAVEKRAAALRMTMGQVCEKADVAHSTWSRAKARGRIRATTLKAVEDFLDQAEGRASDRAERNGGAA